MRPLRSLVCALALASCTPKLQLPSGPIDVPAAGDVADVAALDAGLDAPTPTDGAPADDVTTRNDAAGDAVATTDATTDVVTVSHSGCTTCGGRCVNTQTDAAHCGRCNNACPDTASCMAGVCVDRCDARALDRSYLGCEFWPVTLPNSQLDPQFGFTVAMANPQPYVVSVTIRGGALTAPRRVDIGPGATQVVTLPWVNQIVQTDPANMGCRNDGLLGCAQEHRTANSVLQRGGAYHVVATGPIAAYQFNPLNYSRTGGFFSFSNDASLLFPQQSLGASHLASTWPNRVVGTVQIGGFVAVVGTRAAPTRVTVTAAGEVRMGTDVAAMHRGDSRVFTLGEGDVLTLVGGGDGDLSGTRVESDAPVAAYVGHDCGNVPVTRQACDHMEEQLPPTDAWGREVVVAGLRDRPSLPSVVRITSSAAGNMVRFDPPEVGAATTLAAGQTLEVTAAVSFRVIATQPVLVSQFMEGGGDTFTGGMSEGDPSMVFEAPVGQLRSRYDVYVPSTYPRNYLALLYRAGGSVRIDGAAAMGTTETVGEWVVLTTTIPAGPHLLESADGRGFGVKVYGVAQYTSYMMPGGLDLRPRAP